MNCPVCGGNVDNSQFCPNCGADMSAFAGVPQEKIIVNQTPAQQMAAGDDSVTQLIPENYMSAKGDDSVTQLIPENFMSAKGDDTATVMLDPSQTPQYMPNQQPAFAQAPNMNQAPMGGYQQPYGQPQQIYQNPQAGYQQAAGFGGANNISKGLKIFALIGLLSLILAILVNVIFATKPIFYIYQSYVGGVYSNEVIEEEIEYQASYDDDYEDAELAYKVFVIVTILLLVGGALNAWSAYARVSKGCVKSPVNKSVGAFVFALLGFAVIAFLRFGLGQELEDFFISMDYSESGLKKFNVYDLCYYVNLIATLINLAEIFTSASAKSKAR